MKMRINKIVSMLVCAVILMSAFFNENIDIQNTLSLTASAEGAESFDVPKNGEEIRKLTVQHVREMTRIKWTCSEDIDFSKSTDWTGNLIYKAGVTYQGVPYISGRMDGDSDVYEFSKALDENSVYVGPKTWQTMIGSDCGGGPRLGFAWSGALYERNPGNDFSFEPLQSSFDNGLKPLGDYEWREYDEKKTSTTYDTIMTATGEQRMYECYALMQGGDVVWTLLRVNDLSFGEHIRFAIADARIVRNADGTINGRKSTVRFTEQTSGIRMVTSGVYSTWNTADYTFYQLFQDGYIPMTMEAYSKTSVEYPEFSMSGVNISGNVGVYDLLSGRINCNYNIFELNAVITDENGNKVTEGKLYPYMISADLSRMSFTTPISELKSGKYHYTLKATIGYGEKTLIDTDIEFAGVDEMVVYISDEGTGNGSSPENALGNAAGYEIVSGTAFKNSALYRAVEFLSETGGTIVVCGKVSITTGHYYGTSSLSDFTIPGVPVEDTTIKLTSVYGGVDYREKGASITVERTVKMIPHIELKINTVWDDIDLVFNNGYGVSNQTIIACGNKKTVIGEGVNVRVINDGFELESGGLGYNSFPIICGGYRYAVDPGDTNLTILGGTWRAVVAGPCGVDSPYHGILEGSTNLTIGGKALILGDVYGGSFDTLGSVSGDINININGGTVKGDIILAGNGGVTGEKSKATLTVTKTPQLLGEVKLIGPRAGHNAPAGAILDFTNAWSKSVLPTYDEKDFTLIYPQVINLAQETEEETTAPAPDTSESVTDTSGAGDNSDNAALIVILCGGAAVVIIIVVAAVLVSKKQKK